MIIFTNKKFNIIYLTLTVSLMLGLSACSSGSKFNKEKENDSTTNKQNGTGTDGLAGATGPQGPQGATGAMGATGSQGPAGTDAGSLLWTQNGSDIYYNSGSVGIGTNDPQYGMLQVTGNSAVRSSYDAFPEFALEYNDTSRTYTASIYAKNTSGDGTGNSNVGIVGVSTNSGGGTGVYGEGNVGIVARGVSNAAGFYGRVFIKPHINVADGTVISPGDLFVSGTVSITKLTITSDKPAVGSRGFGGLNADMWYDGGSDSYFPFVHKGAATGMVSFNYLDASDRLLTIYNNGNVEVKGTITQNSDIRLKKEIQDLKGALAKILNLRGVSYFWKDSKRDKSKQIGVIAQEVEKQFPEFVKKDEKGYLSVNYSGLVAPLIEGMKEQQKQIDILKVEYKKEIADLKKDNNELKLEMRKMIQTQRRLLQSMATKTAYNEVQ